MEDILVKKKSLFIIIVLSVLVFILLLIYKFFIPIYKEYYWKFFGDSDISIYCSFDNDVEFNIRLKDNTIMGKGEWRRWYEVLTKPDEKDKHYYYTKGKLEEEDIELIMNCLNNKKYVSNIEQIEKQIESGKNDFFYIHYNFQWYLIEDDNYVLIKDICDNYKHRTIIYDDKNHLISIK